MYPPRKSLGNAENGFDAVMPYHAARPRATSPEVATNFIPATCPSLVIANSSASLPFFSLSRLRNHSVPIFLDVLQNQLKVRT